MSSTIPKNGLLSGMLLPAIAAAVLIPLALFSQSFRARFAATLTPELERAFLLSVVLMGLHKLESFWSREYDQCPVYWTAGQASWAKNPRKAVFLGFTPIFVLMIAITYMAFMGPPWHLVIVGIWLGLGAHELHHAAKSVARARWYPGVVTSLLFVAVTSFGVFPPWNDAIAGTRGAIFYGYYALLPCAFVAFYLEDRRWIAAAPEAIWNPRRHASQRPRSIATVAAAPRTARRSAAILSVLPGGTRASR